MLPKPQRVVVIYHGKCADGFSGAWVCRRYLEKRKKELSVPMTIEYYPGVYQVDPPDTKGAIVYMVDFSYKRPVMQKIIDEASAVIHLDHHKTAIEDLAGLEAPWYITRFDNDHSGAMIAWNYFFPNEEPPTMLRHIEDRDLWRFKLQGTREINAAVFSYDYTFENWDELMTQSAAGIRQLENEGAALERKHFKDIKEMLDVVYTDINVGGYVLKCANLPYTLSSDAGHILCETQPFGCCFYFKPNGVEFSLRSNDTKVVDVSEIAKQYGGGGHRNAAGFRVTYEKFWEMKNATPQVG